MFNSILIIIYLFYTPVETVLYFLISMFLGSKIIDTVVVGLVKNKSVIIISQSSNEIKNAIINELHRGVTIYNGEGGYTNTSTKILNCIISHHQVPLLKELVFSIDPHAFIYFSEAIEVNGKWF